MLYISVPIPTMQCLARNAESFLEMKLEWISVCLLCYSPFCYTMFCNRKDMRVTERTGV